ncbi:hypothetical protein AVEN_188903-1 [Araneus ventricosus]|uniref:Uncharacterized protein n=1 Tax=Araneus ventricosus TaxID=182803 RepID=A0A4Y2P4C6_ARAVE|nr:hypothetical protein AVEN_188903-1 [Araneus ventricosus]
MFMFTGVRRRDLLTEGMVNTFTCLQCRRKGPANRKMDSCMFTCYWSRRRGPANRKKGSCLHVYWSRRRDLLAEREWFMHVAYFTAVGEQDLLTKKETSSCMFMFTLLGEDLLTKEWIHTIYMFTGVEIC